MTLWRGCSERLSDLGDMKSRLCMNVPMRTNRERIVLQEWLLNSFARRNPHHYPCPLGQPDQACEDLQHRMVTELWDISLDFAFRPTLICTSGPSQQRPLQPFTTPFKRSPAFSFAPT